jgi:hypothetical protein
LFSQAGSSAVSAGAAATADFARAGATPGRWDIASAPLQDGSRCPEQLIRTVALCRKVGVPGAPTVALDPRTRRDRDRAPPLWPWQCRVR